MDNHPIPQDVTGFQFKLIGNMTVKQFAYLAIGVIIAAAIYKMPINFLIRLPFCAFFSLLGTGLAYLPISGRPMDLMIGNYIKALFRPTQFMYEKIGGQIYFPNKMPFASIKTVGQHKIDFNLLPKDELKIYLESLGTKPKNKADEKESNFLMSVSNLATNNISYQAGNVPNQNILQTSLQPNLIQQAYSPTPLGDKLQMKTPPLKSEKVAVPQPAAIKQPIPSSEPPAKLEAQQHASFTKVATKMRQEPEELKKNIKPAPKGFNRTIGMPNVPSFPNLITGITKDARGNDLSNILVEVKDKDGNPVRAFKTNEFGRFASATPLMNGTYTIEFEDPKGQNRFGKMTVNAVGQIILPIESISIDMREELRMSLFPTSTPLPEGKPVPGGAQIS